MNIDLVNIPTSEFLEELIRRDKNGDSNFHLMSESVTNYTFKFWKFR